MTHAVASNVGPANPCSVAIDLDGADHYHYEAVESPWDAPGLLAADADGRTAPAAQYGAYTQSKQFRQGAARNGIAMLFDFGGDDDRYASLRGSQGYAHLGVGVLFDDGGADEYAAEASSQGSAQFGLALLVDAGGHDSYAAFSNAQGFGFSGGVGALVDRDGDDRYTCDDSEDGLGLGCGQRLAVLQYGVDTRRWIDVVHDARIHVGLAHR